MGGGVVGGRDEGCTCRKKKSIMAFCYVCTYKLGSFFKDHHLYIL